MSHHGVKKMKKCSFGILFFFAVLRVFPLMGAQLPKMVDFGHEFEHEFYGYKFSPDLATTCPFNCGLEMSTFFLYLKDHLHIDVVVETGTFKGNTTAFFGSVFPVVHTVEVNQEFYQSSQASLNSYSNIQCHFGSSPDFLKKALPSLAGQRILFYLDAHWYEDWPLLDELKVISMTHRDNCVIVIDDFKVPGRADIPYDSHRDGEYCYEYVKKHLDKIFTNYSIHYLIPKDVNSRAKFVAMPKEWSSR
jgi:hypothetical protein